MENYMQSKNSINTYWGRRIRFIKTLMEVFMFNISNKILNTLGGSVQRNIDSLKSRSSSYC